MCKAGRGGRLMDGWVWHDPGGVRGRGFGMDGVLLDEDGSGG